MAYRYSSHTLLVCVTLALAPVSVSAQERAVKKSAGTPPVVATPDPKLEVPIRAGIVLGDLSIRPIPQLELRVVGADGSEAARAETDLEGRVVLKLAPGAYRVESVKPVSLWGGKYSWSVNLDVAPGMRPLELTQKNAGPEGVALRNPGSYRPGDETKIFEEARPGIFAVYGNLSRGTGFLADERGLVVTNLHVLDPDQEVRVRVDEQTKLRATLVAYEPSKDLAVLAIAMSRCGSCKVLRLAEAEPIVGERVLAVGTPLHHTPAHREGTVTRLESPLIFSDINLDHGFSGGPLLTLEGRVAGVNTYLNPYKAAGKGTAGSLTLPEVKAILEKASSKLPATLAAHPPADTLLPSLPEEPYPSAPLKEVAQREAFDLLPYRVDKDNFEVVVMTPPVMAWREGQAVRRRARTGLNIADSIQLWDAWEDYVKDFRAAVVLNVAPKVGKKGGAKIFGAIMRVAAIIGTYGMLNEDMSVPNDYEFKADFRDLKLLRDGTELVPAERGRVSAVANPQIYSASGRQLSYQGVYAFRPQDFAPRPDGTAAAFSLEIDDARKPGQRVRIALDPRTLQAIQRDFAAYHAAGSAQ
jgi:S1-C subfamily serine protease